jgi:hypothetical protein
LVESRKIHESLAERTEKIVIRLTAVLVQLIRLTVVLVRLKRLTAILVRLRRTAAALVCFSRTLLRITASLACPTADQVHLTADLIL